MSWALDEFLWGLHSYRLWLLTGDLWYWYKTATWMPCWKFGSMIRISGFFLTPIYLVTPNQKKQFLSRWKNPLDPNFRNFQQDIQGKTGRFCCRRKSWNMWVQCKPFQPCRGIGGQRQIWHDWPFRWGFLGGEVCYTEVGPKKNTQKTKGEESVTKCGKTESCVLILVFCLL